MPEELRPACVATRLTPTGRGAVAVVEVEGASAMEYVARHFVSAAGKPLTSFPLDRIIFGTWAQPDGQGEGMHGEEVVVCRTGEAALEVNCHGGIAAARAIISALVADGAVERSPEGWASRHSGDLIAAEALLALAESRTERTASILLDQSRGALRRAIEAVLAEVERGEAMSARRHLESLLKRSDVGLHLTKPWRIAFAGPPNVGKSSLVNCLLGYQRSIVFDQPGTTRDLLSAPTVLDGWPIELIDTAGLCESQDMIEVEGIARATRVLAEADLTILVFDATCDWGTREEQLLAQYPRALCVLNKCDLREATAADRDALETIALTGEGVPELILHIVKRLVRCEVRSGDGVPFTTRQVRIIDSTRQAIDNGDCHAAIQALSRLINGHERPTGQ